ncbi:MAG TPA: hypothetical protein VEV86_10055, partial [Vicinamibacterales bacterium]|nr:hypothetical protein [Vicinamibacterales bacterium]
GRGRGRRYRGTPRTAGLAFTEMAARREPLRFRKLSIDFLQDLPIGEMTILGEHRSSPHRRS